LPELGVDLLQRLEADPPQSPTYLVAMHTLALGGYPELRKGYRAFRSSFYRQIVPQPEVAELLDAWYDAHLRGHFVVGVNVATGNGLFAPGAESEGYVDTSVFDDEEGFLRVIEVACEKATKRLSGARKRDYKIFVATDSAYVAELVRRLPRAVTRREVFPPPGAGRYFSDYDALGYTDRAAAVDTLVDMLLLARCDALVKNNSRFSFYARVVNDYFGGNEWNFEKLYGKLAAASGASDS
jgi:nodulation protein Z